VWGRDKWCNAATGAPATLQPVGNRVWSLLGCVWGWSKGGRGRSGKHKSWLEVVVGPIVGSEATEVPQVSDGQTAGVDAAT
jgi:hypothetical protein